MEHPLPQDDEPISFSMHENLGQVQQDRIWDAEIERERKIFQSKLTKLRNEMKNLEDQFEEGIISMEDLMKLRFSLDQAEACARGEFQPPVNDARLNVEQTILAVKKFLELHRI